MVFWIFESKNNKKDWNRLTIIEKWSKWWSSIWIHCWILNRAKINNQNWQAWNQNHRQIDAGPLIALAYLLVGPFVFLSRIILATENKRDRKICSFVIGHLKKPLRYFDSNPEYSTFKFFNGNITLPIKFFVMLAIDFALLPSSLNLNIKLGLGK